MIEDESTEEFPPVELEIDGMLDLHTFHPRDVASLLPAYLEECSKRGIGDVRVIHGKGTGALQRKVHALLKNNPLVQSYRLASSDASSWGATLVTIRTVTKKGKT